ncbi:DUF421 domain-containing protein [Clostridium sporogenes]|uniref:DUF421 domain-containing protein n=1 Tax=Clostridium TaxID=1485 RepID=UPI0005EE0D1B|nr:DUF421 domain-containing protein [Clostridium sporogenes]STC84946.1 YdfR family membrane protein [Clostridium botulinum]KYN76298.1 hypothetical protein A0J52_15025 [Clostridium sporogenes]MBW5458043.1 DUF421 domain-containing protein [Clostridium sporogenes]MCW6087435.1 DUF421 domain-containing protein [Clostridium sporogenes]MDS1005629.1 DUF421 domain-containing protein [Clostridium sporogenes]
MELIKEFYILIGRIITILPLMLAVTLVMGKRSIAELPVFDFLIIVILGAVVGADIADPEIKHIYTTVAIILIGIFHIIVSKLKVKYRKFGHVITFEPTIVIQEGKFIVKNLRKIRYSIDNILQMLREKDIFDINDVHIGIVEANGNISILKKTNKTEVTIEDLNLQKGTSSLSYPVIIEGEVYKNVLSKLNLTEEWLNQQLINIGVKSEKEIFFASVNNKNEFHASLKSFMEDGENIVLIYH